MITPLFKAEAVAFTQSSELAQNEQFYTIFSNWSARISLISNDF